MTALAFRRVDGVATEIVAERPVRQDEVDHREERTSDRDEGLLRATLRPQTLEVGPRIAVALACGGPGRPDEHDLQLRGAGPDAGGVDGNSHGRTPYRARCRNRH
jgi:hypothetical protein